ncbi:MAG: hypothetical protein Q9176_007772 [Flavoplaca citrina]
MSFTERGPDHAREALVQANERLLESGQGADLTIITKDGSKKYHSAIVCPRSSVLSAAYWGSFKESLTKTIDLSEDNPLMVDNMMRYFYLLDYPGQEGLEGSFKLHAQMYVMGDKFDVSDLRKIAARRVADSCESFGKEYHRHPEEQLAASYLKIFRDVVCLAYKSLPEMDFALSRPLAKTIAPWLAAYPHLLKNPDYQFCCIQFPLFGLDMQAEILFVAHAGDLGWRVLRRTES